MSRRPRADEQAPQRVKTPTRVFATERAKWDAIVQEISELHLLGRPVLIGTRTIDKSEILSGLLQERKMDHSVLNANRIAEEAEIVADAGHWGKVTDTTKKEWRGTDIKMPPEVLEICGLMVICTEVHESRIDRQLIGRCGRQGDPGSFRQYLCLEDEILEKAYGPKKPIKSRLKARRTRTRKCLKKKRCSIALRKSREEKLSQ